MPNNLPNTLPPTSEFLHQARTQFDRAVRLHLAWRVSASHADKLDGARRTLTAIDDTIRELTACRKALAAHIETN